MQTLWSKGAIAECISVKVTCRKALLGLPAGSSGGCAPADTRSLTRLWFAENGFRIGGQPTGVYNLLNGHTQEALQQRCVGLVYVAAAVREGFQLTLPLHI